MSWSWPDCLGLMEQCLQRMGGPQQSRLDAAALSTLVTRVDEQLAALVAALGTPVAAPSEDDRAQLVRLLASAGEQLAALDRQLGSSSLPAPRIRDILRFAHAVGRLSVVGGVAIPGAWFRTLPLVLRCSARACEAAATPPSAAPAAGSEAFWSDLYILAVDDFFMGLHFSHSGRAELARSVPPDLLRAWLAAAGAALQRAARLFAHASAADRQQFARLVHIYLVIAMQLCSSRRSAFSVYHAALRQDRQVLDTLVQLLLPEVAALAVALALPPERRPAHANWELANSFATLLTSEVLAVACTEALGAAPGSCVRLLKAAASLVQHAPCDGGSSAAATQGWQASEADVLVCLVHQLGCAAVAQLHSLRRQCAAGAALSPVEQCQQVRLLLPLLPKLTAAVLHAARDAGGSQQATYVVDALRGVLDLLLAACRPAPGGVCGTHLKVALMARHLAAATPSASAVRLQQWSSDSGSLLHSLAAWCSDSTAALRALPLLARAAEAAGPSTGLLQALQAAGQRCLDLLDEAASAGAALLHLTMTAPAAAVEAAFAAIWRLSTAYCRAVHWAAAGGAQAVPALATCLQATQRPRLDLVAAASLVHASMELKRSGPHANRPMQALAAAAWETLAVTPEPSATAAADAAVCLIHVAASGPAAIACSSELQAALSARVQQAGPALMQCTYLHAFSSTPHFKSVPCLSQAGAQLVCGGVLDALLRALGPGDPAGEEARLVSEQVSFGVRVLLAAAGAVAKAAAGGCTTAEQPLVVDVQQHADALRTAWAGASSLPDVPQVRFVLPPLRRLAAALLAWWRRPEQWQQDALERAHAATARSCAYLRCANLAAEGGPAAGEGAGSSRCSGCRVAWYCDDACSRADWRSPAGGIGHRSTCAALAAERQAARAAARQGQHTDA